MIELTQLKRHEKSLESALTLALPFDKRKKSRQRAQTNCGRDVGIFMPRGTVLEQGDLLSDENGTTVLVEAAPEALSIATADDALLLMRAAYHLGNRHMPLQIEKHRLLYQEDYVLDDMLRGLGLSVSNAQEPFSPENGAYSSGGRGHHHD
ncbi:urease accessory protein UreE [Porticoccus sp. W117]|uniref:urease accessory protein UreE n=1 Tax=Porticoccus sp. W117 TaxID=3054777 RepID=UPI002591D003|nr:urease accessory protein UreE [Porticoccus sp. W117]MDM3872340.1 urease accessory protein UreE [Porticoccus sp. W117]